MRLVVRLMLGLAVVVLAVAGCTARLFVWPPQPRPGSVDAVVSLSGDHGERLPIALRLVRDDPRRVLVLAGEPDTVEAVELCTRREPFEVVCLRPNPDSTRQEARAAADLVSRRGWDRIAVVTATYHQTRAGMLFRRCVDATVIARGGRPPYGRSMALRIIFREVAASLYFATMERSC